jgi:hypothetical protein
LLPGTEKALDRRAFFGVGASAAVAAPSIAATLAKAAPAGGTEAVEAALSLNGEPLRPGAYLSQAIVGKARSIDFGSRHDHYIYRTGYPEIDALRSVSGVHKAQMERRLETQRQ